MPTPEPTPPQRWAQYTQLGLQFALSIALPTALGIWGDTKWGTLPLFTLLGALLGTAAAIVAVVRATQPRK
ncbi:MAG: AtpZ/AtpI family protein [Bacteroidia bacterium]|nr:AtpZ/AtpI family protein [Bacteroidia bacterium]